MNATDVSASFALHGISLLFTKALTRKNDQMVRRDIYRDVGKE